MNIRKKYRLVLEDESHLEKLGEWKFSAPALFGLAMGLIALSIIIGFVFVLLTPAKQLIPGYYRPSQRAASEAALMRVDSIKDALDINNRYIENILYALDTERGAKSDSSIITTSAPVLSSDSLLPASKEETRFVHMMQEREKFNISVIAPLAAEGMLFYPVSRDGIMTSESRESVRLLIATPENSSIDALADGSVVAVYGRPGGEGLSIVMQHPNGFVSRYSGLGQTLTAQGDIVNGGQAIALTPLQRQGSPALVGIEIWHNGNPLIPYNYIGTHLPNSSIIN